jgi:hypothetical protein
MNELNILQKQTEIDFLCLEDAIDSYLQGDEIAYLEDGDASSGDSFFETVLKKLNEIFERIKETITNIFTKKENEEKIQKVNEAIKKDPTLGKKKVKLRDHSKEKELDKKTMSEIGDVKTVGQLAVKMDSYRKQRNKAIAIGATVTVTLAFVGSKLLKKKDQQISELTAQNKEQRTLITRLGNRNNSLRAKLNATKGKLKDTKANLDIVTKERDAYKQKVNPVVKAQVTVASTKAKANSKVEEIQNEIRVNQEITKATAECAKNLANTIVTESKEALSVITSSEKSITEKVSGAVKSGKHMKEAVTKVGGGTAKGIKNIIASKSEALENAKKQYADLKTEFHSDSVTPERKKEIQKDAKKIYETIKQLQNEISGLKDR